MITAIMYNDCTYMKNKITPQKLDGTICNKNLQNLKTAGSLSWKALKKFKKKLRKFWILLKIWKMEHLPHKSQFFIFHNIFKYMIFQRRQKALLWSNYVTKSSVIHMFATETLLNSSPQDQSVQFELHVTAILAESWIFNPFHTVYR